MVNEVGSVAETVETLLESLSLVRNDKLASVARAWQQRDRASLQRLISEDGINRLAALESRFERAVTSVRACEQLGHELNETTGPMVLAWAHHAANKRDVVLAPLLEAASTSVSKQAVRDAARARVLGGPLVDALVCLPLSGDAQWLINGPPAALARVDLLLWEAGSAALPIPELGRWLWTDDFARQLFVMTRARSSLRDRSLASRILAIAADGVPHDLPSASLSFATRVTMELASHPEPIVWIPAARAVGRLSGRIPNIRNQLVRWQHSTFAWKQRRAVTALAAMPNTGPAWALNYLRSHNTGDPWALAAIGPAIPYLARERRDIWEPIAASLMTPSASPPLIWSVVQGLEALVTRGPVDAHTEHLLRHARRRSERSPLSSTADAQLWQAIHRRTDFLDSIAPDPSFPDELLERTVSDAVRVGAHSVQLRAATAAKSIGACFESALASAPQADDYNQRGHITGIVESCARASALGLWQPILEASDYNTDSVDHTVRHTRKQMAGALMKTLEANRLDFSLRRTTLRALGNLVDAHSAHQEQDEHRGSSAAFALSALTKSKWARDLNRTELVRFRKPVTDLLWRVSDALQGACGHTGRDLGLLAAWWAISVEGIELLNLLRFESKREEQQIESAVTRIRNGLRAATSGASMSMWSVDVMAGLDELGAADTMLGYACDRLFGAIHNLGSPTDEDSCPLESIADTAALACALQRDPLFALAEPSWEGDPTSFSQSVLEAATQSIELGTPTPEAVASQWGSDLGPLFGPVVTQALRTAITTQRKRLVSQRGATLIGPYRKIRRLGGGGQSEVWLVTKGTRRRYVLKIPNRPLNLRPAQRDQLNLLLNREARLLESLHEAKVATFHDHGWVGDTPFLVLQYLIGVDLDRYARVRPLTVGELKPIVRDVCLGLRALHERGIVHRDLKPSNIFLRLQLPKQCNETFQTQHRDPQIARISEAVLIDLGIAKLVTDGPPSGHEAEGTLGFLSPEQASLSAEVSGKSDVYGLAATIYTAITGKQFFEESTAPHAHVIAHALQRPFDNDIIVAAMRSHSPALVTLLSDATELDGSARPTIDEFADRFARVQEE